MSRTETTNWDVRTVGNTVVVELPAGLELTQETGEAINESFFATTAEPDTETVLTLLNVENPLSSGLFDEVKRGAEAAAGNGIARWAIVVQERVKGMAFDSQLSGLETKVFEDETAAREWLDNA